MRKKLESARGAWRGRRHGTAIAVAVAAVGMALLAGALWPRHQAAALAGCELHTNTPEEQSFIGLLQSWRDQYWGQASVQMEISAPLNAAAAGYARYLADHPGAGGHYADGAAGYSWVTRAVNCGYPSSLGAGGEGLASLESSALVDLSASQALTIMTSEPGGGVYVPPNVGLPTRCLGVAKASAASGRKVAWVTLIFAAPPTGSCPQNANGQPPSPPGGESPTSTATATKTPTKTPTPTATSTPLPRYGGYTLRIVPDAWVLVTLPPGPIEDVLGRVNGCYEAVYQQQGESWLRFSLDVPGYARNLTYSNGGAFWIEGTSRDCGTVPL